MQMNGTNGHANWMMTQVMLQHQHQAQHNKIPQNTHNQNAHVYWYDAPSWRQLTYSNHYQAPHITTQHNTTQEEKAARDTLVLQLQLSDRANTRKEEATVEANLTKKREREAIQRAQDAEKKAKQARTGLEQITRQNGGDTQETAKAQQEADKSVKFLQLAQADAANMHQAADHKQTAETEAARVATDKKLDLENFPEINQVNFQGTKQKRARSVRQRKMN